MKILRTLKEKDLLFFDIETARLFKELPLDSPYFSSWEYKKRKDKITDNEELLKTYKEESGLYPEFSKVVCIVMGRIKDGKLHTKTYNHPDEQILLSEFNEDMEAFVSSNKDTKLVGFANLGFDTPFIQKRMIINGIRPNDLFDTFDSKPWLVNPNIDLSVFWTASSWNRGSLLAIATAFGLPSPKDDIAGYQVGDVYWNEGEKGVQRISEYCERDVLTTANIFRKLRFEPVLELAGDKNDNIDVDKTPLLKALNNGGTFGAKQKKELEGIIGGLNEGERQKAITILEAIAVQKGTKVTKKYVEDLKKKYEGETAVA